MNHQADPDICRANRLGATTNPWKLRKLLCAGAMAAALLPLSACYSQAQAVTATQVAVQTSSVTLEQAHDLLSTQKAVVFDIREPHEHARGVAPGMRLLPMSQLKQRMDEIPKNQPVLLVCNTQSRSYKARQVLQDAGWNNVRYVEDGMNGWAQRGWPLVGLPAS